MQDIRRRIELIEERDQHEFDTPERSKRHYGEIFDDVCKNLELTLKIRPRDKDFRYYGYIPEYGLQQSIEVIHRNLVLLMSGVDRYFEERIRSSFNPDFSLASLKMPTATREAVKHRLSEKGPVLAEHFGMVKHVLGTRTDNPNKTIWEKLEPHEMIALNATSVVHVGALKDPSAYCSFWEIGV